MKSASKLWLALLAALALACGRDAPAEASGTPHTDNPWSCMGCHLPEFQSTTHPPHASVRPQACSVCHRSNSWHGVRLEHPWWALTGAHARAAADRNLAGVEQRVKCFWCHRGEPAVFGGTPHECLGCHAEDRAGVKFPEHDTFSTNCEQCHSTEAWKPAERPLVDRAPLPSATVEAPSAASATTPRPVAPKVRTPTSTERTPPIATARPGSTAVKPDVVSRASRKH